ncbi:hypothetical protein D9M68_335550 [compost metagenome]|uniref:Uncharacterized protein n=1 Tax=Cupriavidus necator TaxID=106590 RepID=A0A367P9I8_CUPNE|nr:hypothetical protein [Cupriavidus necator]QQX89667.1 hypothetical protein JJQ59_34585 [Cupriavidus necator]RCJ03716.1 hypothetical protein DDK22_35795 [Cupriavidus necator]
MAHHDKRSGLVAGWLIGLAVGGAFLLAVSCTWRPLADHGSTAAAWLERGVGGVAALALTVWVARGVARLGQRRGARRRLPDLPRSRRRY